MEALGRSGVRDTSELDMKKLPEMEEHHAGSGPRLEELGVLSAGRAWLYGASSQDLPGL